MKQNHHTGTNRPYRSPSIGLIMATPMVSSAKTLAKLAHMGQTYGDSPYFEHLEQTVDVISQYLSADPLDSEALVSAAYLHDAIEDTPLTKFEIQEQIGPGVARIVEAVTDVDLPGRSRAYTKKRTYPKYQRHPLAPIVKMSDRIANLRNGIDQENFDKLDMYIAEERAFMKAVDFSYQRIGLSNMALSMRAELHELHRNANLITHHQPYT